jgi:hypothetical protein
LIVDVTPPFTFVVRFCHSSPLELLAIGNTRKIEPSLYYDIITYQSATILSSLIAEE